MEKLVVKHFMMEAIHPLKQIW